ncbi:MAG: sigma 54-interacting transcriptional regulator [Desulfobulbales bacterium]|nr:sigma 54-interacting transcriptional regulator [Desulfobulbales bacterium]
MNRVLFVGEEFRTAPVLAAAFFNKNAGGTGVASAAVTGGEGHRAKLRETLAEAGLAVREIIEPSAIDLFNFDLIVFFSRQDGDCHPYPPLPGLPPVLVWQCGDEFAGTEYSAMLKAVRARVAALLDQGLATLLESRRNTEQVLDNLQEGIIAHDLKRRIFFFNKAAERITGYRRQEVLGRDCHLVFPGNFCGGKCSFCSDGCPPQLPARPYSLLFNTADGEERQLEMSVNPIADRAGTVRGVVASFRDFSREQALAERLGEIEQFAGIIGRDPKIQELFRTIRELADSDVPVLISGESGTGKELVAAAIHNEGSRGAKLLVPVNCGALPENLLESELFGHVRGAFTGAIRDKKGRFELADGGTIFLDEIGDISPAMQVKLLRVLQNGTFHRVGGEATIQVDVRVISATNKDLRAEIAAGRFREDLFYRLCVVPLVLPPLRERRSDIPLLAGHFIKLAAGEQGRDELTISPEVMDILLTHDWPGNIRELQNVIRYLMVRCREETARVVHLPENLQGELARSRAGQATVRRGRKKLTVDSVRRALAETGNNRLRAAKILGVGRATLYRFLAANPG